MAGDILALADWLAAHQVRHVAMESTGGYWKPRWNLLEDSFPLLLVNARHVKAVPGRKTDVRDCEWLAELLRHGLLTGSFVPDRPQRELRELTRNRSSLVRERTVAATRLPKTLEGATIKLAAVATDILGTSGREILTALVAGETDAAALAQVAQGRLREKLPQLERALVGCVGPHQRFLVAEQVAPIDFLDDALARVSAELAERVRPDADAIARLDTIPGVGQAVAETLVAEIGTDVGRFPTAKHLASWAGLCPGNHESAGKRRSGATRKRGDTQGESLAPGLPGPGRPRGGPHQGDRPGRAVPAAGRPSRPGEGRGRSRPLHPDHRRPPPDGGNGLSRSRRQLLR
jgi:transposase